MLPDSDIFIIAFRVYIMFFRGRVTQNLAAILGKILSYLNIVCSKKSDFYGNGDESVQFDWKWDQPALKKFSAMRFQYISPISVILMALE